MKQVLTYLAALLASLALGASAWALPFNSVYVFGDSLSDAGSNPSAVLSLYKLLGNNCDPYHPCPPYFDGRYSNGPVASEYLANTVLPGGANPANFHSFAVSGATTGIGNFGDGGTASTPGFFGLPGFAQQIALYQGLSGGVADPGALYFVWGGANDFLTLDSPITAAQNIAGYVASLAADGAKHILVPNLPDLGLTPFVQGAGLVPEAHGFSVGFNTVLAAQLGSLGALFPGTDIIQFDTFTFLNDVVANPAAYGFTDSGTACLPSLLDPVCANPDGHVFWDVFHPSTHADAVIAAAFAKSVPEPATLALVAVGLLALLAANRQGRRTGLAA